MSTAGLKENGEKTWISGLPPDYCMTQVSGKTTFVRLVPDLNRCLSSVEFWRYIVCIAFTQISKKIA